ncbi:MAG: hypothetical protein JO121_08470, partial [Deltaproteobacteria bacterium]|nr:hypothetical protein [Deltaproteobacteria bacterium]
MSTDGKDKFDALIASTMRGTRENSGRDCPDADVLAAYASRSLDPAEPPRWDQHVARCELCQRALAALVRAGAVGPATEAQPPAAAAAASEAASGSLVADEDQGPHGEGETIFAALRRGFRFMLGPFPLSVALHVLALLFLIITVHEQRGRELIMVNLEAGGGGGGGSEMQDLDMPEVPMPDTAPQQMDSPQAVDTSQAVGLANDYVRAAGGGGIG